MARVRYSRLVGLKVVPKMKPINSNKLILEVLHDRPKTNASGQGWQKRTNTR